MKYVIAFNGNLIGPFDSEAEAERFVIERLPAGVAVQIRPLIPLEKIP